MAAAVANSDRLANAIQNGEIKESDVRVIYKSPSFPPAAIGCVYNLKPELVAKIKLALTECNWDKAGLKRAAGRQRDPLCSHQLPRRIRRC